MKMFFSALLIALASVASANENVKNITVTCRYAQDQDAATFSARGLVQVSSDNTAHGLFTLITKYNNERKTYSGLDFTGKYLFIEAGFAKSDLHVYDLEKKSTQQSPDELILKLVVGLKGELSSQALVNGRLYRGTCTSDISSQN